MVDQPIAQIRKLSQREALLWDPEQIVFLSGSQCPRRECGMRRLLIVIVVARKTSTLISLLKMFSPLQSV